MVVAAAGVLAATLWGAWSTIRGAPVDLPRVGLFLALGASSYLILSNLVLFDWRGQRVALAPDEVLVFLALLALPPQMVVLFAVPAMTVHMWRTKRAFLRSASNVAVLVLASAAGAVAYSAMRAAGILDTLAIPGALVLYTGTTHLLVSSVFALREGAPVSTVFGERFLVPTLLHVALGVSGGVAIVGLWRFHPLALLALLPFAYLGNRHLALVARTEREALVNRRLREVSLALAGERDVDSVASRVLRTCGELLRAGRAEIVLDEGGRERRWSRDFEGGAHPETRPLAASFTGVDGGIAGALLVLANGRTREPFQEADEHLLHIVAAETGAALANARALRDLDAARARLETVLSVADDGVLLVGTDGLVQYANAAGRSMLGLRQPQGAPARDLFDDVTFLPDALQGVAGGHLYATMARGTERRFPAEVSAAPVHEEGKLAAVLVVVRDATERKAAEQAMLSSRVARPLVKRIVRTLMEETGADSMVLMRLGETLAREADAADMADFARAYAEMGFGRLVPLATDGKRSEFRGEALFEARTGARATTCYLALGYLCGAVGRQHEQGVARGAEVSCVSRGDAECRFVVHVRDEEPDPR
jgi:PAS domain S-box-containing protein